MFKCKIKLNQNKKYSKLIQEAERSGNQKSLLKGEWNENDWVHALGVSVEIELKIDWQPRVVNKFHIFKSCT